MKSTVVTRLLASGLLIGLVSASGCASSDIDALRSQLADVQKLAEQAQQTANAASSAASAAQTTAKAAQASTDQLKTMVRQTDAKVNDMNEMMMKKKK